jgi:hypothetical protein
VPVAFDGLIDKGAELTVAPRPEEVCDDGTLVFAVIADWAGGLLRIRA